MPRRDITTNDIVLIVVAIFLPPLAAFLRFKLNAEFWISLLLTILCWIPGIIYTIFIIVRNPLPEQAIL